MVGSSLSAQVVLNNNSSSNLLSQYVAPCKWRLERSGINRVQLKFLV